MAWVDNTLEISETANYDGFTEEYDFKVFDNPNELQAAIDDHSVHEAGCIHTTQGLEFDYVGVIIGDDMRYEDGNIITDISKRAKSDQSLKGLKSLAKVNKEKAFKEADEIIKNTYRMLMTRGMKGVLPPHLLK